MAESIGRATAYAFSAAEAGGLAPHTFRCAPASNGARRSRRFCFLMSAIGGIRTRTHSKMREPLELLCLLFHHDGVGARGEIRTHTLSKERQVLSLLRLLVPPLEHSFGGRRRSRSPDPKVRTAFEAGLVPADQFTFQTGDTQSLRAESHRVPDPYERS